MGYVKLREAVKLLDYIPINSGNTQMKEKLKPYWNEQAKEISSQLWLPTKTVLQDLELNSSSTSLPSMAVNSWYSMTMFKNPTPSGNLEKIYSQSSISSLVTSTVSEEIQVVKSKKIRVFPTNEQKKILNNWFGVSRLAYNSTIDYLNQPGVKASYMVNASKIYHDLPEFAASCPSQIRQYAIKDAHEALKAQKAKFLKTGKPFRMRFRSRKNPCQGIKFATANYRNGLYRTKLGTLKMSQKLPDGLCDGRLTLHNGQYHIIAPYKTRLTVTENQGSVVALDPGVRTFQTFYSPESCGEIGKSDIGRIYRLCSYLDKLIGQKQFNAAARMRIRIKNLVKELHHKTAHFLCSNFKVIFLPTFETSEMVKRSGRKIRSKTARALMTWSHYSFKQFLKHKAVEFGATVVDVCEAYTSKTCSWTGELINVGSSKTITSKVDAQSMSRDINGARGIFIRALLDTTCDVKSLQEVTLAS
jgi:putative transposase